MAFAPFSQNSATCGAAGFGQAQETQAKPSALFWRTSSRSSSAGGGVSAPITRAIPCIEPQPPAAPS